MISPEFILANALLAIVLIACAIAWFVGWSDGEAAFATFMACLFVIPTVLLFGLATWPTFDGYYHSYEDYTGVVDAADRPTHTISEPSTHTVISFVDDDRQLICDSARCALIAVGETVTLRCKPEWHFTEADSFTCKFGAER